MAVAYDSVGPSSSGIGSATSPLGAASAWTHTTVAASTYVLAAIAVDITGGTTITCTLDGTGMTALTPAYPTGGGSNTVGGLFVFWAAGVTSGLHHIVATESQGGLIDLVGGSIAFSGATGLGTPYLASAATVAVTSNTSGNLIAAFIGAGGNNSAPSGTSRFLDNYMGGGGGYMGNAAGQTAPATGSSVTMSWTSAGGATAEAILAVEVQGAAAAGGGPQVLPYVGGQAYRRRAKVRRQVVLSTLPGLPPGTGVATAAGAGAVTAAATQIITGTATAAGAGAVTASTGKPYIASVSSDGTYLQDQYGHPRLFACEDIWAICANAGRYNSGNYQSTYDTYFSQRAAQGYTAAEVSFMSTGDPNDNFPYSTGQDWDAAWPFNGSNDPTTTPNSTFWARRDYMFTSAAANGITVVPNFPGVGPSSPCASWTNAQWTAYGTFLGNRYKTQPNIIWIAGDGTFGAYTAGLAYWLTALRATGDTHIVTYQNGDETSSRVGFGSDNAGADPETFDIYAQMDWVYTYNTSYQGVIAAITQEPSGSDVVQGRIPVVWGDGDYIGASTSGGQTDVHLEQNLIWWAMSSGACGFSTGDNAIITWDGSSPGLVTSTSFYSATMPAITGYLSSLPGWWKLRPDTASALVTAGRNSQTAAISTSGSPYISNADDYVTAAYAADGSLAVIYCAAHFSITINQAKMAAGYTATWVDPATCATTTATPGSTYNSTPLGNNSTGFADWVLVLQGTPAAVLPNLVMAPPVPS